MTISKAEALAFTGLVLVTLGLAGVMVWMMFDTGLYWAACGLLIVYAMFIPYLVNAVAWFWRNSE